MANPYHDEEGKFTSRDKQGSAKPKVGSTNFAIKLKPGVDLSNFPKAPPVVGNDETKQEQASYSGVIDLNVEMTMPVSIEDAMAQGNKLLGADVVHYLPSTNLGQAFEMNKALKDVVSDFPKLFENNILTNYGTLGRKVSQMSYAEKEKIANEILSNPLFVGRKQELASWGIYVDQLKDAIMNGLLRKAERIAKLKPGVGGMAENAAFTAKSFWGVVKFNPVTAITLNQEYMMNPVSVSNDHYSMIDDRNDPNWDPHYPHGFHFWYGNKTATYATATHELGHHICNQLEEIMTDDEKSELKDMCSGASALVQFGQISGYAGTSRYEQIAEAISDVFCRGTGATKHNQEIYKFFKKVYNRFYGIK